MTSENGKGGAGSTRWTAVQEQRLKAANASRSDTAAECEDIKGDHTEAKKLAQERKESLLEAISAASDKHGDDRWSKDTCTAIDGLSADFTRADEQFEIIDRRKRRTNDQLKKLEQRVFDILDEIEEGPDLYASTAQPADPEAWKHVLLADIVGDMIAAPFAEDGIVTIADAIERRKLGEAIKPAYADYMRSKVAIYAETYGHAMDLPKGFAPKGDIDVPELEKPAKPEKPAKADGYDPSAKPGKAWAATPFDKWPINISTDFLQKGLELLAPFEAATPLGLLKWLHSAVFPLRDPIKIAEAVPQLPRAFVVFACECIAEGLHAWADPAMYDLVDGLDAMCSDAFDDLCLNSHLAVVARRPADQRYGRSQPVEHVDVAGKITRTPAKEEPAKKHPTSGASGGPARNGSARRAGSSPAAKGPARAASSSSSRTAGKSSPTATRSNGALKKRGAEFNSAGRGRR